MGQLTSRERMLRAISRREVDHIPCCFMSFTALRKRKNEDLFELARAERAMGLDSMLFIPAAPRPERPEHPDLRGLPVRFSSEVKSRQWTIQNQGEERLHREFVTPAGTLTAEVRLSEDWPHGSRLPFVDDYQVPRTVKPLITQAADLDALRFLLTAPDESTREAYSKEVRRAKSFVDEEGVLLVGGWGVGTDMADWLCGMESFMMTMIEDPPFAADLMGMIHDWNRSRMEVVLSGGVDLFIRRAWYEGCDFITKDFWHRVLQPQIRAEADLAHEHGARFGYICSSGTLPLMDLIIEAGIDVLIGVDPVQGTYTDMPSMKEKARGKMALWGGVSGAVTVEMGTEAQIRQAVAEAVKSMGPDGFILSPVDNITLDEPKTWENLDYFIDAWKQER